MRSITFAALAAMTLTSGAAFAGDGDHDGDETTNVVCRALDAAGKELTATSESHENDNGSIRIVAEGDIFAYVVTVDDGLGILTLTDKRSGDKLKVREGDFDIGETVAATLETDEDPEAAITLECVGR